MGIFTSEIIYCIVGLTRSNVPRSGGDKAIIPALAGWPAAAVSNEAVGRDSPPLRWVNSRLFLMLNLLLFSTLITTAQTKNKAYGLLLKGMYKNTVPTISCAELKKQQKDVVLLDTRPKTEFAVSHLPQARWVGYKEFELSRVADLPKNTAIVVYCSVGYRSERVGEKLLAAGYTNVKNLYGSLFEWVNEGNSVVDSTEQPTKRVHAYSPTWGIWLQKGEKVY